MYAVPICVNRVSFDAGASNLAELNRVLSSTVMVRRLKNEVLDQLPPKRRQHVRHTSTAHPMSCMLCHFAYSKRLQTCIFSNIST